MKTVFALLPFLCAISCTPTTPQGRIAANPGRFSLLSEREKSLVENGRIDRGMSMQGVSLAWGEPSRRYSGSRAGRPTERWVYSSSTPVYAGTFFTGYGWGGAGRYGYRAVDIGLSPRVDYVPEDKASVLFVNSRVESWERRQ